MLRIFCCLLFLLIGIIAVCLPNAYQDDTGETVIETALDSLPNIDLLKDKIEPLMQSGDIEEALAILDVALEEYPEDRVALEAIQKQCLEEKNFKDSPLGVTASAINGFITGRVDDMASLAGSTVGDFFLYGDIRDLTKELLFEDDPDKLIIALSSAGIAAEALPAFIEAKPAISLLKVLRKCSSLTRKYVDHLLEWLRRVEKLDDYRKLPEILTPALELGKQTKSFFQFNTLIRACKDTEAVKFLTVFAKKGEKVMSKMTHVFSIAGKNNPNMQFEIVDFLKKHGENGLDYLKKASLKGVNGISHALKHPWLKSGTKAVRKGIKLLPDLPRIPIPKWWEEFAKQFPNIAKYTKTLVAVLCFVVAFFMGIFNFLKSLVKLFVLPGSYGTANTAAIIKQEEQQGRQAEEVEKELNKKIRNGLLASFLVFLAIGICIGLMALFAGGNNPQLNFALGSMKMDSETSWAGAIPLVCIFLFYIPILAYLCLLAKRKIREIEQNSAYSTQQKLSLMENADLYFDLPLYCGLGMTILSFIVITLVGASSARLLAYAATLLGIICTVCMRVFTLSPAKEKLLSGQDFSDNSAC